MAEQPNELKKLLSIATDMELSADLRIKAIDLIGGMSNHEALLALLSLAANDKLVAEERDLALKRSREIIKSGRA